jgi:hypothetical protein
MAKRIVWNRHHPFREAGGPGGGTACVGHRKGDAVIALLLAGVCGSFAFALYRVFGAVEFAWMFAAAGAAVLLSSLGCLWTRRELEVDTERREIVLIRKRPTGASREVVGFDRLRSVAVDPSPLDESSPLDWNGTVLLGLDDETLLVLGFARRETAEAFARRLAGLAGVRYGGCPADPHS